MCLRHLISPHRQSPAVIHPNPRPGRNLHKGASSRQDAALGTQRTYDRQVICVCFIFFLKTQKQHSAHLLSTCVLVHKSLVSCLSLVTVDLPDSVRRASRRRGGVGGTVPDKHHGWSKSPLSEPLHVCSVPLPLMFC